MVHLVTRKPIHRFFLGGGASSAQIVLINLFFMMIMSAQACSPLLCLHKQQWPA